MVPGFCHGPGWQPRPCAVAWPSVVRGDIDINKDCGCGRATDPDMALVNNPETNITMAPDGKQAFHISLFLNTFTSSYLTFSTGHEPFCLFLSPNHTKYLLTILVPNSHWLMVLPGCACPSLDVHLGPFACKLLLLFFLTIFFKKLL